MIKLYQEGIIVCLFKEGLDPKEISKQTKIGIGSVRLIGTKYGVWKTAKEKRAERREVFAMLHEDFKILSYDQLVQIHGIDKVAFIGRFFDFPFKKKDVERQRKRTAQLAKQNHSTQAICNLLKLSKSKVSGYKSQMKITRPRLDGKAMIKRDKKLLKDYLKGMSTKKIQEKYKLKNIGMVLIKYPEIRDLRN